MKKTSCFFAAAAAVATAFSFVSCDPKNPEPGDGTEPTGYTITAVVENGNDYNNLIDTVKVVEWNYDEQIDEYIGDVLAIAPYKNGGFTLTLPAVLPDKYLYPIIQEFLGLTIVSDTAALVSSFMYADAYKNGEEMGYFSFEGTDETTEWTAYTIYADRDFALTGFIGEPENNRYNCQLKKGWNIIYAGYIGEEWNMTTTKPAGATFNWYYVSYEYTTLTPAVKSRSFWK